MVYDYVGQHETVKKTGADKKAARDQYDKGIKKYKVRERRKILFTFVYTKSGTVIFIIILFS